MKRQSSNENRDGTNVCWLGKYLPVINSVFHVKKRNFNLIGDGLLGYRAGFDTRKEPSKIRYIYQIRRSSDYINGYYIGILAGLARNFKEGIPVDDKIESIIPENILLYVRRLLKPAYSITINHPTLSWQNVENLIPFSMGENPQLVGMTIPTTSKVPDVITPPHKASTESIVRTESTLNQINPSLFFSVSSPKRGPLVSEKTDYNFETASEFDFNESNMEEELVPSSPLKSPDTLSFFSENYPLPISSPFLSHAIPVNIEENDEVKNEESTLFLRQG